MGNVFIVFGLLLVIFGILVNVLPKGQIPLMPGDIFIQKEHVTIYIPVVSSIVISVILTLLFNLLK